MHQGEQEKGLIMVSNMTHDEIADWCAKRIRSMGYKFSFSNMTSVMHGEQPDVFGLSAFGESVLVEVKVSRTDFLADQKKPWRRNGFGMGDHRVYLTPKGLLKPEEIPYGWMLWEVHGKTKPILKVIKGQVKKRVKDPVWGGMHYKHSFQNCDIKEYNHFISKHEANKSFKTELTWLIKILSRAMDDGFEPNNYANNYQKRL